MKHRFLLKLIPVALVAAFALVLGARSTPRADASVSGLTPSSFVVNAGSPVGFSFVAQAGAGNITIAASSAAITFISPSCAGCAVSGNGTSAVTIVPPQGTSAFSVSFTLDVSCTAPGIPISVTASQGNALSAFGTTGNCANNGCVSVINGCCLVNGVLTTCAINVPPVTVAAACGTAYTVACPAVYQAPQVVTQPVAPAPVYAPPPAPAPAAAPAPVVVQQPVIPRTISAPNTGDGGCLASGC
jgi:hypothetical protein